MTNILIRKRKFGLRDMHMGRFPHEDEGKSESGAPISQGAPKLSCQQASRRKKRGMEQPLGGTSPSNTLVWDL